MKKEKPMRQACKFCFAAVLYISMLIFVTAGPAGAVLKPEEVLIVVNVGSPDSVRLGKLYAELRRIPQGQIAEIKAPFHDSISRSDYERLIAEPLRKVVDGLQDKGKKIRCITLIYGVPLRISSVKPPDTAHEAVKKYEENLEEKIQEKKALERMEKEKSDDKDIPRRLSELKSDIRRLQFRLDHLLGSDTVAAVDSELALLLFPSYELAGWQPNPEFIPFRGRIVSKNEVLMVSRIDAPSPELVEKMIRTAVEVDKTGISGRIYLDARGLTGSSTYAKFDDDIRRTAQILAKASMPVELDNRRELFGPGEAPEAALYCGWYSLGTYRDAFEWVKGAVGYHVASSEAVSLHNPKSKYWVKSMLEKGVIASVGPVAEPYLTAFPPPSLFFPLLMSGRYALAEVFAMTNPFLSWRMILVGDPLYNPFRLKPVYLLKDPPPPP